MKLDFWLLDINPKIGDSPCELWLWGIDADGNRVLVIERNFTAYFYAVVKEGFDPSKTAAEITKAYPSAIVKAEVAERRYFGKPVQAIKVCCKVATETSQACKATSRVRSCKRLPRRRHSHRQCVT